MKRAFLVLGIALAALAACSSNEDDTVVDASLDQSQESSANDATTDVTTKPDATPDATVDVQQETGSDASDATTDTIFIDVSSDAPIVDAIADVTNGCVDNNACNSSEFCDKGTGNCNGVGTCTTVPQFCPQFVFPVCGCDNKTYNNSCYANKGLTSVAYTGTCE